MDDGVTWVVVFDGREARTYAERVRHGPLKAEPRGYLATSHGDRPHAPSQGATVHDRMGAGRHGVGDEGPEDRAERRFLARLADLLGRAAEAGRYDHLALFATPRPLGILKAELPPAAARRLQLAEPHNRFEATAEALRIRLREARLP